jgi:RHS repeat-associated protein
MENWNNEGANMNRILNMALIYTIIILNILILSCDDGISNNKSVISLFLGKTTSKTEIELIKVVPQTIIKEKADTTEEKENSQAIDTASDIWSIFDSNTNSIYSTTESIQYKINFKREINLKRIKLFGATSYQINIYQLSGDKRNIIPELCVNKNYLKDTWNILSMGTAINLNEIVIEIIPDGEQGIREMEFWSEEKINIINGVNANLEEITTFHELDAKKDIISSPVLSMATSPDEISLSGSKENPCLSNLSAQIEINPILIKRAYISYLANNIATPVSIERKINSHDWLTGYDIEIKDSDATGWKELLEEINPRWLVRGGNTIQFRTAKDNVSIKNLKIFIETDTGWNRIIQCSKIEIYDSNIETSVELKSKENIDITFERPIEPEAIMFFLPNKVSAKMNVQYLMNNQWNDVKPGWSIDFTGRMAGWNKIYIPTPVKSTAFRLQPIISDDANNLSASIELSEIRVCGSPSGEVNESQRIIVSYPRNGEFFGRDAYIQGFVTSDYQSYVAVENKAADQPSNNNAFGITLSKNDTRFSSQGDDDTWEPVVSASNQSGIITRKVNLSNNQLSSSSSGTSGGSGTNNNTGGSSGTNEGYSTDVFPGSAKTITYGPIIIEIPVGAVDEKITITIIPLTKSEIAPLNPGMINVTYPAAGYRFLVNGKAHYTFKKSIFISFTYGKNLLIRGQSKSDVFMYYYDKTVKTWKRLKRADATKYDASQTVSTTANIISSMKSVQISDSVGLVTSETDHFTDIINGTITVPEQPDPLLYNPNTIKDIKVGDPGEGINLIETPTPNSMGDARLSYPIDVPPGRNGMQPIITIIYNSSHENGWLGGGWDIPVKAVVIDTKFGVPRYDGSEKYLMDGESIELGTDGFYHTRVEGAFRKIKRNMDGSNLFWWEVIDKNGVKYIYGQNNNARLTSYRNLDHIYMWCLEKIIDPNGNNIIFKYYPDNITTESPESSKDLYLETIVYTGYGNSEGKYSVIFKRDDGSRKDRIINCRGGFKMTTRYRLSSIDVKFEDNVIRSYQLQYKYGEFNKSLLESIKQYGVGGLESGKLFNQHQFDYYNEIRNENGNLSLFESNSVDVTNVMNNVSNEAVDDASLLNGSYTNLVYWIPCYFFAGKNGSEDNTSRGLFKMIDIDGDLLPDQLFVNDNKKYFYRKNLGHQSNGDYSFSSDIAITSLNEISDSLVSENVKSVFGGARFISDLWSTTSSSSSESSTYFSDVNGDGLVDFIHDNKVYYNSLNEDGKPVFSDIRPAGFGSDNDVNLLTLNSSIRQINEELVNQYHRDDPILMWEAPYNGRIRISGDVGLLAKEKFSDSANSYLTSDGVRVSIQRNKIKLWEYEISSENNDQITPAGVEGIDVFKGDKIFFRVNSIFDGAYDYVKWNPSIEYIGVDTETIDENGKSYYKYEAKSDLSFVLSDSTLETMKGKISISGIINKKNHTSDDISVVVNRIDSLDNHFETYKQSIPADETGSIIINVPGDVAVEASEKIEIYLKSDTAIDWSQITSNFHVTYTEIDGINSVVDENGNPRFKYIIAPNIDYFPIMGNEPTGPFVIPQGKSGRVRVIYSLKPLTDDPLMADDYHADVVLAIKNNSGILIKEKVNISKSSMQEINIDHEMNVQEGDKIYFICASNKYDFRNYVQLGEPTLYFEVDNGVAEDGRIKTIFGEEVIGIVYRPTDVKSSFSGGYRNWYYGRWNGEIDNLDPDLMKYDDITTTEINNNNYNTVVNEINQRIKTFSPMGIGEKLFSSTGLTNTIWVGKDIDCFIGRINDTSIDNDEIFLFSSTRVGRKNISQNSNSNSPGRVINRITVSNTTGEISKSPFFPFQENVTTTGNSTTTQDYFDVNGDQYPDLINESQVQFTKPDGSLGEVKTMDFTGIRKGHNEFSGSDALFQLLRCFYGSNGMIKGLDSLTSGTANSYTDQDFVDMNGDGLPDMIYVDANDATNVKIRYNLGYQLGGEEIIEDKKSIRKNYGKTTSLSIPFFTKDFHPAPTGAAKIASQIEDFFVGIGELFTGHDNPDFRVDGAMLFAQFSNATTASNIEFIDINGDSLPDRIEKKDGSVEVTFNNGWNNPQSVAETVEGLPSDFSINEYKNLYHCPSIAISGMAFWGKWLVMGGSGSNTVNFNNSKFIDINGDGYLDYVKSDKNNKEEFKAYINKFGKTNLLRKVSRPLGGSFIINYEREGNTTKMPKSKWVLASVNLTDGEGNTYNSTNKYTGGYFDRQEREFYGFEQIKTTRPDNSIVIQKYNNTDYYRKRILYQSEIWDNQGRLFITTKDEYREKNISTKIIYPYLETREKQFYEGGVIKDISKIGYEDYSGSYLSTKQSYEYDRYGNITKFTDNGHEGDADDIEASIAYQQDRGDYIVGKPTYIIVRGNDGKKYRERGCSYENGNLKNIKLYVGNGDEANTTMSYDQYGNITSITDPIGYYKSFAYENKTYTHISTITDNLGYSSEYKYEDSGTSHPIYFGKPGETEDINDKVIRYEYDEFGRMRCVTLPHGDNPSVNVIYGFEGNTPYSETINKAYEGIGGEVKIRLYIDSFKRPRKTLKLASVNGASKWITTNIKYNNMGRIQQEIQPYIEGETTAYSKKYTYDVLGRKILIENPDGTDINISYGFEENFLCDTIRDQLQREKKILRDLKGSIIKLKEHVTEDGALVDVISSYAYNPIGEITRVIDANGKTTHIEYDNLGRKSSINNPDAGLIEYTYDLAGNVKSKVTSNLKSQGKSIIYGYKYHLLEKIQYPDSGEIIYSYGTAGEGNSAGRIKQIVGPNFQETRQYDELGNISESSRSIKVSIPEAGIKTYTTKYKIDFLGRMRQLIFEGGECVQYDYDAGGLLASVKSGDVEYVKSINYNQYSQRTKIDYGNGNSSIYDYYPQNQRLHYLKTTSSEGKIYQNIEYKDYDDVGNIKEKINSDFTSIGEGVNATSQYFTYDEFDRLISSTGTFHNQIGDNTYMNTITYGKTGNIKKKIQLNEYQESGKDKVALPDTSYNYTYEYTSGKPHAVTSTGIKTYEYDNNGNMIAWTLSVNPDNRMSFIWDEENRLSKTIYPSNDPSKATEYRYDDVGKRTLKKGIVGEVVYFNDNFTRRNGDSECKHIFAGNTRVATRVILNNAEAGIYYYHVDHLGSSNIVTNKQGGLYEHLEYFPYGETWVQEKASSTQESMPYKFTSKEQDPETGMYYFGARYYDAKLSKWISTDPAFDKFLPKGRNYNLPGYGGVYNSKNLDVYNYSHDNPVGYLDPDGNVAVNVIAGVVGGVVGGAINGYFMALDPKSTTSDIITATFIGAGTGALAGVTMGGSLASSMAIGAGTSGLNTFLTEKFTRDGSVNVANVALSTAFGAGGGFISSKFGSLIPKAWNEVDRYAVQGLMDSFVTIGSSALAEHVSMNPASAYAGEMRNYTPNLSVSNTMNAIISPALRIDYYSPALFDNFSNYNNFYNNNVMDYFYGGGSSNGGGGFNFYFGGSFNY